MAAFSERGRSRKTLRLSGGARSTYFDEPARTSGLRYPLKGKLELASRDLGTTAFAAAQVGENCGDRPLQWRVGHQPVLVPTKTPLQASLDDNMLR